MCRFGGAKNAQVALSGAPGRAYQSLWGPLWPLLGPWRSEKSIFRHPWWNLEGNRCAQNPRSAPGPPRRTPKGRFWSDVGRLGVDLGATLGVHVAILDRFWSSRGRFRSHFGGPWANFGSILDRLDAPCGSMLCRSSDFVQTCKLTCTQTCKHTHNQQTNRRRCKQTSIQHSILQSADVPGTSTLPPEGSGTSLLRRSSDLYRHANLHAHKHASRHTISKQTDDYANKHRCNIQSFNLRPSPEHRHYHRKDPEH